ncbi:hypothetical protein WN944_001212 [Citrus x changshan-huyou]|uniref:Uncharacterized protein n=1 Tax=Citrus x changshan-huyou TaxID=2935761 RepID=A0AAP0MKJ3_9ROSI
MRKLVEELHKKSHFHESQACGNPPKIPLTSSMLKSVKVFPKVTKCIMLDLVGCDVVEGRWSSSNLNALVHHIPVGSNTIRVLHGSSNAISKALCKVMPHMSTIENFVGSTITWPPNELS